LTRLVASCFPESPTGLCAWTAITFSAEMSDWNPDLYLKFSDQRGRPAADLIAQVNLENPQCIIDLGCGTGTSTERLHARWPKSEISGLDSSATMLAKARQNHPAWKWLERGIEDWRPERRYNLIFSNAALHWVVNHGVLFPRLLSHLAYDGALAVQMPCNLSSPANQAMKKVAADPCWAGALEHAAENTFVEPAAFYYNVLRDIASHLDIWETEYLQIVDGPRAVLDWLRSTGMRTYLEKLSGKEQRGQFEELCLAEFEKSYPATNDGKVLFPYRRLFIVAYR